MRILLSLILMIFISYGAPYYSLYGPNGFTDLSLNMLKPCPDNTYANVQKEDYCLYRSFDFLVKGQDFMIFLPSGVKAYEINVIRIGSDGIISGILSMSPTENYKNSQLYNAIDGSIDNRYKEGNSQKVTLSMLLEGKKLVYPNVGAVTISAYNISKDIFEQLDKWIFFDIRKVKDLTVKSYSRSILPQTGFGEGYALDDPSSLFAEGSSSNTSAFYFADLKFGVKYYFDKNYVDSYVKNHNLSGCEEFNESVRNLCLYIKNKYKNNLFKDNEYKVDTQKFVLYDADPVTEQVLLSQLQNSSDIFLNDTNNTKNSDNAEYNDIEKIGGKENINVQNVSIEEKLKNKSFQVKGYWIQYEEGAYDWIYIRKSDKKAFKLQGIDGESGRLKWDNINLNVKMENDAISFK